jgi:hypothetical protein
MCLDAEPNLESDARQHKDTMGENRYSKSDKSKKTTP